jgi:hypothetical protein
MPFIGNKPSAVPLTSADITDGIITSAKIVDGTIVNADINASSAIALSKLSTTGTASSSNYLRGDGAWTAVSSDYVLLATTDASSSASVSFDGYFSSTYKNYKLFISNAIPTGASNYVPSLRFRRSNADITTSNYYGSASQAYAAGANTAGDFPSSLINMVKDSSVAGNNNYGFSAEITIFDALSTSKYKMITGIGAYLYSTTRWYVTSFSGTLIDATTALSGITYLHAGAENITTGNFKLYGIK